MELSTLPPRMELAVQPNARDARVPPQAVSVRPETLRPVVAAAPPPLPAPIKGLGIAPLDLLQVGDNDEAPVPAEPRRVPGTLSTIPAERRLAQPDPQETSEPQDTSATPEAAAPPEKATRPSPSPMTPLPELLAVLNRREEGPTFDLRR